MTAFHSTLQSGHITGNLLVKERIFCGFFLAHLGDFDEEVHKEDYMVEFKFVPHQVYFLDCCLPVVTSNVLKGKNKTELLP